MANNTYRIERASQQNSHALAELFYKIFGYTYINPEFYDRDKMLRHENEGTYQTFVCLGPDNVALGMIVLDFSFPSPRIIEIAEILIDPDVCAASSGQILKQLIQVLRPHLISLADNRGLRTVVSVEVTEHSLSQRLSQEMGFMTAGVYLGYCPGWQRQLRTPPGERIYPCSGTKLTSPSGRRTMIVSARPFRSKTPPQQLSVPARFEELIHEIYKEYRLQFEFVPPASVTGAGRVDAFVDFGRGRAVVEVRQTGEDTADSLLRYLQRFHSGFLELVHIILPLSGDHLDPIVEALTAAGVGFAAVLPDYREGPVLIMQSIDRKCLAPIPQGVFSERARRIIADLTGGRSQAALTLR
jgi:hypothetical protein